MKTTVAVFGAGGKMGCRIADHLKGTSFDTLYVEISPAGIERLKERGLAICAHEAAVQKADVARFWHYRIC